ncbi:putative very-long-chain 3-oxoacyl-CoA reductase [Helianthus annuus]|uniref:Putative NAD(P)-binding Rossmann-fold superfamily protein n=1 Tax=Helianthus annuus TaxID=4232 RepID=A0A251TD20_HELAN|nr:short-chain dehydrogenase TIC 32 B, chloroplastic [Helianthus annuus]KAF5792854.1 putative very-long-chain 3-oxoacyl-CoA reductase [Helianthus annuus]KAJ0527755.1 putative very-long-chain 3-oxoacyl-CoA reductase [Helianthus annuus]KAJ0544170.1 putative very-long-chain 3-oxoacyl-CoA reductase [Helianthus annuus]
MLKTSIYIFVYIFGVIALVWRVVIRCKQNMKGTVRYLAGIAGQSGYGSKSTAEQVTQDCSSLPPHLTAIVTGATSGIGAETARVLAKRGVRIVIPARDLRKASQVKENIQRETPNAEIIILEIDLSSFASIRKFCSEFLSLDIPLNILINNAGKFSHKLEFSEDKFEMTFATNYLGHFLLTELVLEKMIETAKQTGVEGRIVNVSSVIHGWVKKDHFSFNGMLQPKYYNATRAYAQSKLANIMHANQLAKQLKAMNANVTINAVHPGIVKTGIIRDHKGVITDSIFFIASKFLKTTSQGASTTCYVALSPKTKGVTGRYFADCNEIRCSLLANDDSEAHKLWKQTRALIHKRCLRVQL